VLFSLHLKATMMKVSDPILFGHAVRVFSRGSSRGTGTLLRARAWTRTTGSPIWRPALRSCPRRSGRPSRPTSRPPYGGAGPGHGGLGKGITNLHVPSDIIIDASMPPMIRDGGSDVEPAGELQDCKAVIPDSSYAGIYDAVIRDCQAHGALDPATMGASPTWGLMAQKAEEYGSHDKTFEIPAPGTVRVVDADGRTLLEHEVEAGDIWRACQTKDVAIRDWVKLAVTRARATSAPAVFWLDRDRAHDAELIREGGDVPPGARHRGARAPHPLARGGHGPPWSGSGGARTRSPSRGTCSGTTSPTSSPSWRSEPAPACSPSCRC
jgi:isocitrate dehydrogenase